jgi:molybdate transport repressor ModE-like protein
VRRLRVLQEVAERGSFSAAADALSFTQSAVSQQIAALERETGAVLIERRRGGVRLTDAGRALVSHTEAVLARLSDAEQELAAIAGLRGGRVRMASFPSAGATLVTRAVSQFSETYPDVELTLGEGEPEDTVPPLNAGEYDLAIVFDYGRGIGDLHEGLDLVHLLDDELIAVLPADHRLAKRKTFPLRELADDPWVSGCGGGYCNAMLVEVCGEAGFQPNFSFESNDHYVLMGLVASGVGVTLLPELALRILHPGVVGVPVTGGNATRRIYAATAADSYRSPATEAMIEVLQAVAREFEAEKNGAVSAPPKATGSNLLGRGNS